MRIAAVICAAGQGKRMGLGRNKQFLELKGKPLLIHTLERWKSFSFIDELVVVVGAAEVGEVQELIQAYQLNHVSQVVAGGAERQDSVYQGLLALKETSPNVVLIHDGARPFIREKHVAELIEAVKEREAAVVAVPVKDTIKRVDDQQHITETLKRDELWAMQTPQGFSYSLILEAHETALEQRVLATDDAALVELLGHQVSVVQGDELNIKLTTPQDIQLAAFILSSQEKG
ncbi:2-C-methyl-D-erythritol 4-phosphate cytidylyltransferase [Bacillus horti]|uniref:2-C-methyl-D-erythritol 4-phosphate cytidylyltransferase n=1 Tax=Caldalkalibacillus horti TaxID=77523 RepID=A0ABT9VYS1_9BACI|nr:2-C-methyl-D-erythritol 4-phosphate cytidylyltransferase [Bacillus horti]MDQ0166039.1 2-C-methyl-D-erythritol 4-phosphate cytidylyltransferase [Bacillus horti]